MTGGVFVEEGVVFLVGFVEEDDGAGGEAVFEGVLGGTRFALGGDGAAGFGSVDAGGFGAGELFWGGRIVGRGFARGG